jgi:anti-anti-sigma factor
LYPSPHPLLSSVSGPTLPTAKAPPCLFRCSRRAERGGSVRLLFSGELDLAGATQLRTALDGAQDDSSRVVLDLQALTLIDCAGLAIIFDAAQRARREGAVLILLDPRAQVRRLLDLIGPPAGVAIIDDSDLPETGARVPA